MTEKEARPGVLWILTADSAKDLFRYKSFLLLIFALALADRVLHGIFPQGLSGIELPELVGSGAEAAQYAFTKLGPQAMEFFWNWKTPALLAGLFLFKQLISLWPSADMRRMHIRQRGVFGIIGSLASLRWHQVLWDAIAVGSLAAGAFVVAVAGFALFRGLWLAWPGAVWLYIWLACLGLAAPLFMAGLSYSSKLAVLSQGSFGQKLKLFYLLFYDAGLLFPSWLFFVCRMVLEAVFVAAIPAAIILNVPSFWLRVPLACLLATPAYSYLKMATFKFFLHCYRNHGLVAREYEQYFSGH
ncbi:MAG: hypothetical protein QMD09_15050 [Desulfatibacillaceae bacterium]|nr:hypothetical protein [Desulfatibacillaceae bacterium]